MKRIVPVMVVIGLLVLAAALVIVGNPHDPLPASGPAMPVGKSTLSHGGPAAAR